MPMLGVWAINLLEMSEGPGLESNHVEVEAVQGIIFYQFQIVTFYIDIILILNWVQMNINDLINYTCDDSRAFLVN